MFAKTLKNYSTNLTDSQCTTILRIINDKRKRQRSLRDVLNALFYLLKNGCQWRMLPSDFPNWERVYYYFQKWSRDGTIEEIHEVLLRRVRLKRGRNELPSVAIIDSQSVKMTKISGECRGIDGGKKIKGRKRHIITDTDGLLLAIKVHAANEHDSRSRWKVLKQLKGRYDRLAKIYADGGYRGGLIDIVKDKLNCKRKITPRTDKSTEFKPLPKRWVVERSFACLYDFLRLEKDYERKVVCLENMICLTFISLMLKCL